MRQIVKGSEPPSLTAHRQTPYSDYDNYDDKNALRDALVTEQRSLCCYCMRRIRADFNLMKIEHWQCQDRYPDRQLNYRNLLGACRGDEGQPSRLQHCDTKKGNADLKWNPADPVHSIERRISYELDGTIRSDDSEFDEQLNEVLNLNLPEFKNNRKGVLDSVLKWWKDEKAKRKDRIPDAIVQDKQNQFREQSPLEPFSQVAVWWLQQKLDRRGR